jgi:hypothetical protein
MRTWGTLVVVACVVGCRGETPGTPSGHGGGGQGGDATASLPCEEDRDACPSYPDSGCVVRLLCDGVCVDAKLPAGAPCGRGGTCDGVLTRCGLEGAH